MSAQNVDAVHDPVGVVARWEGRQHVWEEYFDAEEYPTMARGWVEGDFEAADETELVDSYDYGLERLLDGIEEQASRSTAT